MADPKKPDNPRPAGPDKGRELVLDRKPKTKKPRRYKVVIHNDDYTTMEFVVWVLKSIFHKTGPEARQLMLAVHHKGKGIAGVYTRDVAETKVAQATALAESQDMPLMITTEPED